MLQEALFRVSRYCLNIEACSAAFFSQFSCFLAQLLQIGNARVQCSSQSGPRFQWFHNCCASCCCIILNFSKSIEKNSFSFRSRKAADKFNICIRTHVGAHNAHGRARNEFNSSELHLPNLNEKCYIYTNVHVDFFISEQGKAEKPNKERA